MNGSPYGDSARVSCQFVSEAGEDHGSPIDLPLQTSLGHITLLSNTFSEYVREKNGAHGAAAAAAVRVELDSIKTD